MEFKSLAALSGCSNAEYKRTKFSQSRWKDGWEIFSSHFSQVILANVFALIFFVPVIAVLIIREMYVSGLGTTYPFTTNLGIGYFPSTSTVGMAESIYLTADIRFNALLIAAGIFSAVGVSGILYVARKMLNTGEDFKMKDFFVGIKTGFFACLLPIVVVLSLIYVSILYGDWANLLTANGQDAIWYYVAQIVFIVLSCVCAIVGFGCMAVGSAYKTTLWNRIVCACQLILASPLGAIAMLVLCAAPILVMLMGGIFTSLFIMFVAMMGLSYVAFIWCGYTQYVFDSLVPAQKQAPAASEKAAKKPTEKAKVEDAEQLEKDTALELLAAGKSELIGRPVPPVSQTQFVCVPTAYTRGDISACQQQKAQAFDDVKGYVDEHKNEPKYVEYNKLFAEREKPLEEKGKKKKKVSADNLLK